MKIESNKFINTRKIVEYLGNDVATKFPQIHASAWSDNFMLHVVGKIKVSRWKTKAETSKHNWCFIQSF